MALNSEYFMLTLAMRARMFHAFRLLRNITKSRISTSAINNKLNRNVCVCVSCSVNWFVSWLPAAVARFYCILVIMTFWTLHMHFYGLFVLLKAIYEHDSFSASSTAATKELSYYSSAGTHVFFLVLVSRFALVLDSHGAVVWRKKVNKIEN